VSNLIQISSNKELISLTLGSSHEKFKVGTGSNCLLDERIRFEHQSVCIFLFNFSWSLASIYDLRSVFSKKLNAFEKKHSLISGFYRKK
jgi:hypothetical protein